MIRHCVAAALACAVATPLAAQGAGAAFAEAEYDCVMDPAEIVNVGSPVSGLLDEVLVRRGQRVAKGDVIARLDSEIEAATIALLETRANSTAALDAQVARRDLVATRAERTRELLEKNIASVDQMDEVSAELVASESLVRQAELDMNVARRELERARVGVEQRVIRSPIDGFVLERMQTGGEFLSQDSAVEVGS